MKTFWQFLKKLNVYLPYDHLVIYPKEMKVCPYKDMYTSVLGSFICNNNNNKKMETTQKSINRLMD